MKRLILNILCVLVLTGCNSGKTKFSSQEELKSYLNDPENGFIKVQETSDLIFEARLVPPLESDVDDECTVNLRIKRKDGGQVLDFKTNSPQEVVYRENYLSFDLRPDVSLDVVNGESYPAVFHHYEHNYGLKPSIDILFNFMKLDINNDVEFRYRDQLFDQGLVVINFNKELFNKCYVAKK